MKKTNPIIDNIFRTKMYLTILVIVFCSLIILAMTINSVFTPLYKKQITSNIISETQRLAIYLSHSIDYVNSSKEELDLRMKTLMPELHINKLHYFSNKGKVIYSSNKEKIGTVTDKDYFFNIVAKGEIYSKNFSNHTIEIYIPIMKDETFIGAFEFYYDFSEEINEFDKLSAKISWFTVGLMSLFMVLTFGLVYMASKNNLKMKKYHNELESFKVILNDVGAYIYTKDINRCYTYANQLVLDLFNKPLGQVLGKDDTHFFDLELSNKLSENDIRVIEHEETIENEEKNIIKETGETKYYWTVKKPLYDSMDKVYGMSGISADISKLKNLERELVEQKNLLNIILDNVDAYIYMKDSNRYFRYVNSRVAELFGKKVKDIIGYKDTEVLPLDMADTFWEMDKKVFLSGIQQADEESITSPNGELKHYWSVKLPYTLENDDKILIGFSSDITELHKLKEKLKYESITDSLTELHNRRHFTESCTHEYKRSIRHKLEMSIMIIDIDYFKKINDTYGHPVGDMVLQSMSKTCKSLIRDEDVLCRIGGEEFAILLPHTKIKDAVALAERIRKHQEAQLITGEWVGTINITFSIGVSCIIAGDKNYEDVFSRADIALYKAKESGRNKVVS